MQPSDDKKECGSDATYNLLSKIDLNTVGRHILGKDSYNNFFRFLVVLMPGY